MTQYFYGSFVGDMGYIRPSFDMKTMSKGIIVYDNPYQAMAQAVTPKLAAAKIICDVSNGKLVSGQIQSDKPLRNAGYVYMIETDKIPAKLEKAFLFKESVPVDSYFKFSKNDMLKLGWHIDEQIIKKASKITHDVIPDFGKLDKPEWQKKIDTMMAWVGMTAVEDLEPYDRQAFLDAVRGKKPDLGTSINKSSDSLRPIRENRDYIKTAARNIPINKKLTYDLCIAATNNMFVYLERLRQYLKDVVGHDKNLYTYFIGMQTLVDSKIPILEEIVYSAPTLITMLDGTDNFCMLNVYADPYKENICGGLRYVGIPASEDEGILSAIRNIFMETENLSDKQVEHNMPILEIMVHVNAHCMYSHGFAPIEGYDEHSVLTSPTVDNKLKINMYKYIRSIISHELSHASDPSAVEMLMDPDKPSGRTWSRAKMEAEQRAEEGRDESTYRGVYISMREETTAFINQIISEFESKYLDGKFSTFKEFLEYLDEYVIIFSDVKNGLTIIESDSKIKSHFSRKGVRTLKDLKVDSWKRILKTLYTYFIENDLKK